MNPAIPFAVACLGIATFAIMDGVMKGLSIDLGVYNAIFWRMLIGLSLASLLFIWKRPAWPTRSVLHLHIWRGCVMALTAFLFFWSIARIPLAEAVALSFIAPLIALYLAAVMLNESINRNAVIASLLGLAGSMVVISGSLGGEYSDDTLLGVVAVLVSAGLYGYNLILQRQQALLANPIEITFFQNLTIATLFLVLAPFLAIPPPAEQLPFLASAAVLAVFSSLLLAWAYARAEAKVLIPVEYTAFIWVAIYGWFVFDEAVTLTTYVGTALIVIGCLIATRQNQNPPQHIESTAV
ncbi:MAG: DMT family transporter [Pseudomonadales bacterium]